jgi:UDP-N-acetylmuramate: L-alanyl-gamma-D-glutamyl-meso-diaminopimelate ligase
MRVHFIAIGGSAMHNFAIALHLKGYQVSGSDDEIFEPSKSRLEKHGILPKKMGWDKKRITADLDFIVLGMHARPDNPELLQAQEMGLKVLSYPEFLYEQSKDKTRVVIAGSHGKTTITSMILHVLHYHEMDCDFMVGALLPGFESMVQIKDSNEFMLIEGDEYLSSPIDRRPKFLHYKPNIALLSGIAWDHVNVFPSYDSYFHQFELLLDSIEPGGALVYNELDEEVIKVVNQTKNEIKTFPYKLPNYTKTSKGVSVLTEDGEVPLLIFGKHNMNNLEGARWICNQMGVTDEQFYEAIPSFKGASKRLEPLYDKGLLKSFKDFAHAPSKVSATVNAVKETFPNHKVVACLELHTFSSLSKEFIKDYKGSLDSSDEALVYFNPQVVEHKKLDELSKNDVKSAFGSTSSLEVFNNTQNLLSRLSDSLSISNNTILLIMSSGSFDGIDWKEWLENTL